MKNCREHHVHHMSHYLAENINGRLVINLRDISHTMRFLYEGRGSQRRVLMILSEAGTITQRELTHRLGIQPGSASEVIAKLENLGLVTRIPSEADRRTADLSLTEEGQRQAAAAVDQRKQRHTEMFSALSEEEKEQLLALLEKVNSDWERRYRGDRGHGCHEHHRDIQLEERTGGRRCNHDCENCPHPCGRGGNR